jgi:glycosyltransferase involved in cell wall biosynthesis
MNSCIIIVPAYNNLKYLKSLIPRLGQLPNVEILVINDGSIDNTSQWLHSQQINFIEHTLNKGKGEAIRSGFRTALPKNTELIAIMDGDLQHRPEDLPRFFEKITNENADIVIGKRKRSPGLMPVHRIFSNFFTSLLISIRLNQYIPDSQCGFRVMRRWVAENVDTRLNGFHMESEFLLKAGIKGTVIKSILIPTIYLGNGKSQIRNIHDTIEFILLYIKSFFW